MPMPEQERRVEQGDAYRVHLARTAKAYATQNSSAGPLVRRFCLMTGPVRVHAAVKALRPIEGARSMVGVGTR